MTELTTSQEADTSGTDFLSKPLIASMNLDWEKAIYIAFIIFAIVSRFWGLGDRVMSHDESLHTQFSYQFYRGDGFSHTPLMHGPFLFHITSLAYWLFGDNDFSARVPVAMFGVILVLMPYFLRPWLGRIGAIFTSFIFLISPYLLYYSRYIRHDIYVIVWAMIVFIAIWHYIDKRSEKNLWWFAAGLSLMFATKEVAFIYVAIFGSYVVIRLLPQISTASWFKGLRGQLTTPILVVFVGLLLVGGGLLGERAVSAPDEATTPEAIEQFAADPETDTAVSETEGPGSTTEVILRWVAIVGIGVAALGLFLGARSLRPYLDDYPEFDIIILFSTLVLPFVSPLLVTIAGWNPREYTMATCLLPGQEAMSPVQLIFARIVSPSWWSCTATSGLVRIFFFVAITIVVSVLVGLWWNRRRWLIAAAIFYSIFFVLFTSVFTNPAGFTSGMVGSLGYWLEQQDVQRGSQPWFYYFFVMPFYEFLPVLFSLLAIRLWLIGQRLSKIIGYWLIIGLLAWFSFSLVNWWFNAEAVAINQETSNFPGLLVALFILIAGLLLWFFVMARRIKSTYALEDKSLFSLFRWEALLDIVPFLTWWLLLTWAAYSYAGEKMPWLSTHFVIPMGMLTGWYFQKKLASLDMRRIFSKNGFIYLLLTIVTLVAIALAVGPIILGTVQFGEQQLDNLSRIGRVIGSFVAAGVLIWLWVKVRNRIEDGRYRSALWSLSIFAILALLTIRFAYFASFPNADYVKEYMVYAHGAPAAKDIVLDRVDELSQRLYGDNSIRVAYGGSGVPWPFTWYMREYPNSVYYGESPTNALTESPIVLVGRTSWDQVDNLLGNDYDYKTYTYLWWPMEDYRNINWNAILGDPNPPEGIEKRGLQNPNVRQAIWDIWFYRDFEKYDQTFAKTHTDGQWPLRDELRLYIRKDVLSELWDYGISPISVEPVVEPFTEGEFMIEPSLVLHPAGFPSASPGEFLAPRNVAVAPDGTIFALDSGNQRVQIFDQQGTLVSSFGGPGTGPGQFNAEGQGPWGIAVDDEFVYVADTWNHRVQKFTQEGEFVASFGQPGDISQAEDQGLGFFFGPRDIAILPDGRLLISDAGNHRIQVMDANGNFQGQIGGSNGLFGSNLGFFYEPVGVTVGPNGEIYVADTWNGRVQKFSPDFFPLDEWAVQPWAESFSINNKPYAATDSAGRVYVTDPENFRVLMFSPNGDYLGKFGQFGTEVNNLGLPTGIFIDNQDNIYVADAENNRILRFDPIFAPAFTPEEEMEEEAPAEESDAPAEESEETDENDNGAEAENEDTAVDEEAEEPTPTTEPEEEAEQATETAVDEESVRPTPTE